MTRISLCAELGLKRIFTRRSDARRLALLGIYWKSGRPYLDEHRVHDHPRHVDRELAFIAGKTDWIATTIPLMKDITSRAPAAICEVTPGGISRNLLINRDRPPFNDPEMRRAPKRLHSRASLRSSARSASNVSRRA